MKTYHDIVPEYNEYLRMQVQDFCSMESENPKWYQPQRAAIEEYFEPVSRDLFVLDVGCGDGFGLEVLHSMGFMHIAGVDLNPAKIARAAARGYSVLVGDMHDLSKYRPKPDIIYCSHALEHAYDPAKVLKGFHRLLKPGGKLFVICPYPDWGDERAHGGKYDLQSEHDDGGNNIRSIFLNAGFGIIRTSFGDRTGKEIRLWMYRDDPTINKNEPTDQPN